MNEEKEEKWLSDKGVVNLKDIQAGKLNIIDSPCGCGKTTFVEKKLWREAFWGDLLYLIDSKNGLEAFKKRGELKEYDGHYYYKHQGITAMTYATFAMLCIYKPDEWLWNSEEALIVCDEMQTVIKWAKIPSEDVNLHQIAIQEIHRRIELGAKVVAISATTKKIREEFKTESVDVPIHGTLRRYHIGKTIKYKNLQNILDILPSDQRGLIYVSHISTMVEVYNALSAERDMPCATVWSINNQNHQMSKDDLRVRDSILTKETIPEDIQVLIINAASQTGINIKSPIDYVVVNSTDEDVVTQAIGRVRHDIETAYTLTNEKTEFAYIPHSKIVKWIYMELHKEDKEEICNELNLKDSRGRPFGWTNVKRSLRFSGYSVQDKHTRKGDYSIISYA